MRRPVAAFLLALALGALTALPCAAQTTEELEREFVGAWLIQADQDVLPEVRSGTLEIREIARRADGSILFDARYGWTLGPKVPVSAQLIGTAGDYVISVTTLSTGLITAKQAGPGVFKGDFTTGGGARRHAVTARKATEGDLRDRVAYELDASKKEGGFAQENRDWGIAPTESPQTSRFHAPTPRSIPGVRTLTTLELYFARSGAHPPVLVDVLDGNAHATLAGAHWMPGIGGSVGRAEMQRFATALEQLTKGDRTQALVFFCLSSECWLSYNAALRARELGYANVGWFRGGTLAWTAANLPTMRTGARAW